MRIAIIFAVLAVLAVGAFVLFRFSSVSQAAAAQQQRMESAFTPNSNNRISVSVYGWHRSELDKALADFRQTYELPVPSDWIIATESNDRFSISFPNDIQPKLLYFLINYLRYPRGLDLKTRHIIVTGRAVLSAAFGIPDPALSGKKAIIYIPENDTDYDFVCVQVDTVGAYKVPFTDLVWLPVTNMPIPAGAGGF